MMIHLLMFLKWLFLIEFCLKLQLLVNSIKVDENNKLQHQLDQNVMVVSVFIIEFTVEKIIIFELLEYLFNLLLYSLIKQRRAITYYERILSKLMLLYVMNIIFLILKGCFGTFHLGAFKSIWCRKDVHSSVSDSLVDASNFFINGGGFNFFKWF